MRRFTTGPGLAAAMSVAVYLGGCSGPMSSDQSSPIECTSLLGEPLRRPQLNADVRRKREQELHAAQAEYDAAPSDETAIIWLGRRLAYLGRYVDAVGTFSEGLRVHPRSFRLLRHRGHRFITLRRFDDAIADLSRAAELMRDVPDEIEPDGMPNALGIPTSTTKTNIWYHLGLAQYLRGDFDASRTSYAQCLQLSDNDDMRCAAAYWLVLCQHRSGRAADAESVLATIHADMTVIENGTYYDLLLLFQGEREAHELAANDAGDGVQDATLAYGLAVWKLIQGDRAGATTGFRKIIADADAWAAFGFIAAEAELAAMQ